MNRKLVAALEDCLQALQAGATLEQALAEHPAFAARLRPLLEIAVMERERGNAPVPENAGTRSRVRVLAAASRLRGRRFSMMDRPVLRRLAVSLAVAVFLLAGGSGLLSASATSLPGELLYPFKRSVEDLRLVLTVDQEKKVEIEDQLYDLRIDETDTLLEENRVVWVDFDGILEQQTGSGWVVSGIPVVIDAQTEVEGVLQPGAQVEVRGVTQTGGQVLAERIRVEERDQSGEDGDPEEERDATPEADQDDPPDPTGQESDRSSDSGDDAEQPDPTETDDD